MRLSFLIPLLLVAACATRPASESVFVLEVYNVADVVSDPAEAPRISTADLAKVVGQAAGLNGDSERVAAAASGRLVVKASTDAQERVKIVLADFRRMQSQ